MQILLDTTRLIMAKLGMPMKYWVDTIQIAVYVRNFIPTSYQLVMRVVKKI